MRTANLTAWMFLVLVVCQISGDTLAGEAEAVEPRRVVLISDLHFGVGTDKNGQWNPTEDFRWSKELVSFLDAISVWGNQRVDLVIVGDLLELWQPPADKSCKGTDDPELGCTVAEMEEIAKVVKTAHQADLQALAAFADRGDNRLLIVPGNHDAALLLTNVWMIIEPALKTNKPNRVMLVKSGVWKSDDGTIVAEHGHQIGRYEVNKFPEWPKITKVRDGKEYIVRPWGELFVQKRFNEREGDYQIIDNLSPETAGARYYMAAKSIAENVKDFASFLKFNLLEASFSQAATFLGGDASGSPESLWDLKWARETWGYRLFADALPPDDPFRAELLDETNAKWSELRQSLAKLANDKDAFPEEEIRSVCARLQNLPEKLRKAGAATCVNPTGGGLVEGYLIPRDWVLKPHLEMRIPDYPNMKIFVYAHTHVLEFNWKLKVISRDVNIFNTGAFQRLIDDETFVKKAGNKKPAEALLDFKLEGDEMPACYSAVLVEYKNGSPSAVVKNWHANHQTGAGSLIEACDERCSKVSKRCQEKK